MKKFISKFNKIFKYVLGGILSTFLKFFLTIFFTEIIKIWYFASYSITLLILLFFNFLYNFFITFKNKTNLKNKLVLYSFFLISLYILDAIFVISLTELLNFEYRISIIISTALFFVLKYNLYNKIIFVENKKIC
jgi:putative flippase GtrA